MNNTQIKNSLILVLAAFIWGSTFVAQSIGAGYVGAFTYVFSRSVIAVIFLTPVIALFDRISPQSHKPQSKAESRLLFTAGILSGTILMIASFLQQKGMETTTVGKSGFLTAVYIILVPILGVFLKRKAGFLVWISVMISLVGLYLLCITPGDFGHFVIGDLLVLGSAVFFSIQILVVDKYSPLVDCVRMSRIQFATIAILAGILMFVFETPTLEAIWNAKYAILYAGCLSSGVAYTCQIIGQKDLDPTLASLIMSLESVFSLLSGWIFLHESMSGRELLGSALMFAAIILCQIPVPKNRK